MAHSHKVFQLGEATQLHLQTGDITKWSGDAIVNAGFTSYHVQNG